MGEIDDQGPSGLRSVLFARLYRIRGYGRRLRGALRWGVIGDRWYSLRPVFASRDDSFPAFDLLLLHCNWPVGTVQLEVQACPATLVVARNATLIVLYVPHALQMIWPASSLLQRGVMVVPQFWHAGIALVEDDPEHGPGVLFSFVPSVGFGVAFACCNANLAVFDTRLLNAGHPLQPCCPPVPLHLPPPGHVPAAIWSAAT